MAEIRTKILILLCGVLISITTPLCHAEDTGKLLEVKTPPSEQSPTVVPDIANSVLPGPAQVISDKKTSERSWYWRFLEGLIMSAAKYNTEIKGDGRPQAPGNFR